MSLSRREEWLVVGAIIVAFILIPLVILARPPQLPFRFAFIILPLIPAVGLALLAVWFGLRRRDRLEH